MLTVCYGLLCNSEKLIRLNSGLNGFYKGGRKLLICIIDLKRLLTFPIIINMIYKTKQLRTSSFAIKPFSPLSSPEMGLPSKALEYGSGKLTSSFLFQFGQGNSHSKAVQSGQVQVHSSSIQTFK